MKASAVNLVDSERERGGERERGKFIDNQEVSETDRERERERGER